MGDRQRPPIFLVPSTDGNGLLYGKGPALGQLKNPLYAVVFEYIHSGDRNDVRFQTLAEVRAGRSRHPGSARRIPTSDAANQPALTGFFALQLWGARVVVGVSS